MSVVSAPPDDGKGTYLYLPTDLRISVSRYVYVGRSGLHSHGCVSWSPPRFQVRPATNTARHPHRGAASSGEGGAPIWAGTDLAASLLSLDLLLPVAGGSGRILWVVGILAVERVPVPPQSAAPEPNPPIIRAAEMPFSIAPCRIRRISADVPSSGRLRLPATSCNRLHPPLCSG